MKIKNDFGVSQAHHDLAKAAELERLAKDISEAKFGDISISVGSRQTWLSSTEDTPDSVPKGELIGFICAQAARHRAQANAWIETAFIDDEDITTD